MPEEPEVETKELQEAIDEIREERKEGSWTRWISLSTALLAVVAAVAALQSGTLVNEALLRKNEAVLLQAKASDQWAYYQAKGLKKNGAEQTAVILSGNAALSKKAEKYRKEAERYKEEQKEITAEAKKLEQERDHKNHESETLMHHHHLFAKCVTFTQVAIALSAIAALTRMRPVWYGSMLVGCLGIHMFVTGYLQTGGGH